MSHDQAEGIRRLLASCDEPAGAAAAAARTGAKVIAVTSGKGGVGKSTLAANLAISIAHSGKRVVLVDMDLGLANVDLILGMEPRHNLHHVLTGACELHEALMIGPGGVLVLPGANGIAELADLEPHEHERILHALNRLEAVADVLIVDTGAGIGRNVMRSVCAAEEILVVITPDPASLTDGYAVIKQAWWSGKRDGVRVAVNMSRSPEEALAVAERIQQVSARFLEGMPVSFVGAVPLARGVANAVRERVPVVISRPDTLASRAIRQIARRLLRETFSEQKARRSVVSAHGQSHREAAKPGFFTRLGRLLTGEDRQRPARARGGSVARREAG